MRYLSVCSGIEAASVAWHSLGWEPVAFSEIEPFASAVLATRFPNVPNVGDMNKYAEWNLPAFDILVGGTPCQSFSVAGLRKGLADPRGNLALVYLGILDRYRPRWCVWENVPGVLSVDEGRAFGSFLGGLGKLGYGWSYRILDAQYTRVESHPRAVPQRRRRVFVVGHLGAGWRSASEVLLEPEGVRGDSAPRREARKESPRGARPGVEGSVAGTVAAKWAKGTGGPAGDEVQNLVPEPLVASHLVPAIVDPLPFDTNQVTNAVNRSNPQHGDPCHPLTRFGDPPSVAFLWPVDVADPITAAEGRTYTHEGTTFRMHNVVPDGVIGFQSNLGTQGGDVFEGVSPTVRHGTSSAGGNPPAVAIPIQDGRGLEKDQNGIGIGDAGDPAYTLDTTGGQAVAYQVDDVPPPSQDPDLDDQDESVTVVSTGHGWWSSSSVGATVRAQDSITKADTLLVVPEAALKDASDEPEPMAARRLTPRECERLQGFPDDWTLIDYRGSLVTDGPRYKALGNSMAVNVMRFIGERIHRFELSNQTPGFGK